MKIALKQLSLSWLPMLFLVLTAGSMLFVFFRKEMLYFVFFLFSSLFLAKHIYKRELLIFVQLLILFLSFLLINFLFATSTQSTQKLFANIVIFTSSIFSALYYSREENKKQFIRFFLYIYMYMYI